jgi:dTDP-4-dehydrorhamnose 3,5-epimerase
MTVRATSISGLFVVGSPTLSDERGFFRESYRWSQLNEAIGRGLKLRQANHSRSYPNVLRGFHAEAWHKLVYVIRGTAMCVVADPRPESPTFARHQSFLLGDPPGEFKRLFISEGCATPSTAMR